MEKLIVNEGIKLDLDGILLGVCTDEIRGRILSKHLNEKWDGFVELNKLSFEEMAIALYVGYELEKTPEEELLEVYQNFNTDEFDEGFNNGMKFTLDTLNIKIKGINS